MQAIFASSRVNGNAVLVSQDIATGKTFSASAVAISTCSATILTLLNLQSVAVSNSTCSATILTLLNLQSVAVSNSTCSATILTLLNLQSVCAVNVSVLAALKPLQVNFMGSCALTMRCTAALTTQNSNAIGQHVRYPLRLLKRLYPLKTYRQKYPL
jgi:hypothetical protein